MAHEQIGPAEEQIAMNVAGQIARLVKITFPLSLIALIDASAPGEVAGNGEAFVGEAKSDLLSRVMVAAAPRGVRALDGSQ